MSMSKRLQIPLSEIDESLLKIAAKRAGVSTAEWARRILKEVAQESLSASPRLPKEALEALFRENAPIADVDTMIDQSLKGRFL